MHPIPTPAMSTSRMATAVVRDCAHRVKSKKAPLKFWPPRDLWEWLNGYHELGSAERVVPLAFAAIYVAELIRQAVS